MRIKPWRRRRCVAGSFHCRRLLKAHRAGTDGAAPALSRVGLNDVSKHPQRARRGSAGTQRRVVGSGLAGGCGERGSSVSHIRSLTSVSQRFAADDSQPRCKAAAGWRRAEINCLEGGQRGRGREDVFPHLISASQAWLRGTPAPGWRGMCSACKGSSTFWSPPRQWPGHGVWCPGSLVSWWLHPAIIVLSGGHSPLLGWTQQPLLSHGPAGG